MGALAESPLGLDSTLIALVNGPRALAHALDAALLQSGQGAADQLHTSADMLFWASLLLLAGFEIVGLQRLRRAVADAHARARAARSLFLATPRRTAAEVVGAKAEQLVSFLVRVLCVCGMDGGDCECESVM